RNREQPGAGRAFCNRIGMQPRPEERFLHNVLSSLPVSIGHPQRVPQQGGRVLGIELTDQRLIADPVLGPLAPDAALTHHILVTATGRGRFTADVHGRGAGWARGARPGQRRSVPAAGTTRGTGPAVSILRIVTPA